MASGVPVVTSNIAAPPEIVGDAGAVVDPDNVPEIAEAIWQLLTDQELRRTVSAKGLERAKKFSWEKTAEETLQVFQEVYSQGTIHRRREKAL